MKHRFCNMLLCLCTLQMKGNMGMLKLKEISVTCRSQESAREGRDGTQVNRESLTTFSRAKALAKDQILLDFVCIHQELINQLVQNGTSPIKTSHSFSHQTILEMHLCLLLYLVLIFLLHTLFNFPRDSNFPNSNLYYFLTYMFSL